MMAFSEGYEAFCQLYGANIGTEHGAEYVKNIEIEIEKLTKAINQPTRKIDKSHIDSVKGFVAEWWHEGTFNIDAAVKAGKTQASVPDDNGLVDIFLSSGEEYSVKYGDSSVAQQAKTNYERYMEYCAEYRRKHNGQNPSISQEEYLKEKLPNNPYYLGQGRLIPADQMKDAKEWLERKIAKETNGGRLEQVQRYQEALDKLTDRIKSSDGVESIPLTEEEAKELAQLAKDAGFDPAEWGLKTEELIKFEYIMNQAFKAGLSATLISVALKVAPEICGIICKLIKNGDVDIEDFKRVGFDALQGGTEGFVRGTVAAAITTSCKAGLLGTTLKVLRPSIIGAITSIVMNTIQNACLMSFRKISKHEFANRCAQDLIVAGCSVGMSVAGGAIAAAMFTPAAAIYGYMIGSFIGSVVGAFVYKGIHYCVMALCIENGSTFFGLVEQNYKLPIDVLKTIGTQVWEYEKFEPKTFAFQRFEVKRFEYHHFEPIGINVTFLRRGVIGVGAIGYV